MTSKGGGFLILSQLFFFVKRFRDVFCKKFPQSLLFLAFCLYIHIFIDFFSYFVIIILLYIEVIYRRLTVSFKNLCKIILLISLIALSLAVLVGCAEPEECSHKNFSLKSEVAPTCDTEGYNVYVCNKCTFEYKGAFVAPTGHTLTSSVTAPTCDAEGYTTHTCECGYTYKASYTKPLGHSYSKTVIDATCEAQGYTVNLCAVCTASFISNLTPPLPHDMTVTVTPPDCDDEGFTKKECKNCEYEFVTDIVAPLGHALSSVVTDPSCESEGFTTYTCMDPDCEFEYISDFTKPTGHTITLTQKHASSREPGYIKHTCPCGYEYTDHIMPTDVFTGGFADFDTPFARGIDVSKWNGDLDFEAIKAAGFDFVILKAGSIVGKDDKFEENYTAAKAAGLDVGAYFYCYAKNLDEIDEEAELFLSWLDGKQFEYPVYLDIEDPSQVELGSSLLTNMCVRFIEKLHTEGYFCGIYVNNNWLMNLLDTERITTYFDVWYARYKTEDIEVWGEDWIDRLAMWQYTDAGVIGEHEYPFDMNLVYRDYPTLIKEWGYNGFDIQRKEEK